MVDPILPGLARSLLGFFKIFMTHSSPVRSLSSDSLRRNGFWVLLFLLAGFVFGWRSGSIHLFDLDEALYVSCARQMILTGDYVTPRLNSVPPQDLTALTTPFFEKPILVYWASAEAMRLFGVTEAAARLPVFAASLLTLGLICFVGSRLFGRRAGFLAGVCFLTAPLTVVDARQMTTDGLLVFWISGMLFLFLAIGEIGFRPKRKAAVLAGFWLCAAAAILTKGIVGLLLPALILFFYSLFAAGAQGERGIVPLMVRGLQGFRPLRPFWGLLFVLLLTAPWHFAIAKRGERDAQGRTFVQEYVIRQHIGRFKGGDKVHNAPIFSYFGFLLVGFFPWACFLPAALRDQRAEVSSEPAEVLPQETQTESRRYLKVWIGVIFIFFSLASAKLPTYIAPIYPAAALLVGAWLAGRLEKNRERNALIRSGIGAVVTASLLLLGVVLAPRFLPKNAPVPPEVVALALHLTLILALGSVFSLFLFWRNRSGAGIAALAFGMILLVGVVSEEGYRTAQTFILAPYQDLAEAANFVRQNEEPILYYNIVPRRPSTLFYANYSPIERKDPPLAPFLDTLLTGQKPTVLVLVSQASFEGRLRPELVLHPQYRVETVRETAGWLLFRLTKK